MKFGFQLHGEGLLDSRTFSGRCKICWGLHPRKLDPESLQSALPKRAERSKRYPDIRRNTAADLFSS